MSLTPLSIYKIKKAVLCLKELNEEELEFFQDIIKTIREEGEEAMRNKFIDRLRRDGLL